MLWQVKICLHLTLKNVALTLLPHKTYFPTASYYEQDVNKTVERAPQMQMQQMLANLNRPTSPRVDVCNVCFKLFLATLCVERI